MLGRKRHELYQVYTQKLGCYHSQQERRVEMKRIIGKMDLTRMWGKEKDIPSVIASKFAGGDLTVHLDNGEMIPATYRCPARLLQKLEDTHGLEDVIIISKNIKGGAREGGGFFYNDIIQDILTFEEYVNSHNKGGGEIYVSRFAKVSNRPSPTSTNHSTQDESSWE